ncbi:MAG: hypothetical protein FJ382_14120 [Verrucomicrobia bacterium]|nr:hypothetical protein [Verrucomicrobiota bacterium]
MFQPLGMNDTHFRVPNAKAGRLAPFTAKIRRENSRSTPAVSSATRKSRPTTP